MPEPRNIPPVYHAFDPLEMGALLAHVKGYQHIQVPIRSEDDHKEIIGFKFVPLPKETNEFELKRPYSPSERFLEAVKVFAIAKKIKFPNMKFYSENNTIEAIGRMDLKRARESERLYRALLDWDEKVLDECVNGTGGKVNEKLGFSPIDAPPLTNEITLSDIEFLTGETAQPGNSGEAGTLGEVLEKPLSQAAINGRGRHKNDCQCEKCVAKRALK